MNLDKIEQFCRIGREVAVSIGAIAVPIVATGARVVAYEPMQNYGWAVIAEQPAREAFKSRASRFLRSCHSRYFAPVDLQGLRTCCNMSAEPANRRS
jgi:hypothetical protein